jgi:mRNA interferase RelE/StbE
MTGKYSVYITPDALSEIRNLPGNFKQRVKRAISALGGDPAPSDSKQLNLSVIDPSIALERVVRRIRMGRWRVVYSIIESENVIDILAVRKRPPYDYGDLGKLLGQK